ncbi:MAG: aminomuconate-semialdehyde/2-hydroxymuconate-6-semialdehyde dehydrogenase [Thermoplasmata archaeon]|nr:aminomuconate-semialdehyde/2-hydroxymuconate-6-semialdehyde dehydrogenase [Thermoplasmata archaeon]
MVAVSEGFGWLAKDREVAQRDLARSYGHAKRAAGANAGPTVRQLANTVPVATSRMERLDVHNPATGELIARIPRSDRTDVDAAVAAAKAALPAWSATRLEERCRILDRIADLLERDQEELARLESLDTGKPVALARRMDAARAVQNFRFFAGFARTWHDAPSPMAGHGNRTHRRPLGVVGLITPWNLPLYLLTWKLAPALAMGNTVVAKPSELTPLTADALGRITQEAGLPPGVFSLVHGLGAEAGQALVEHPDVKAVSFTGGTATGKRVAATAAPLFKKISLELGGKNPSIVFADCDLEATVAGVADAALRNQGQICLCGSRVLVESSIAEEFTKRLVGRVKAMRLGDPADEATQLGALITPEHRAKVEGYIGVARKEGGTVLCGGKRPEAEALAAGAFLEPTVITGLGQQSRLVQEEIFGPVVTVQPFTGEAEAVALANGVPYGLAASVWTQDAAKADRVAEALECGMVWVNCWLVRDLRVPFGGMKQSGVGREGGQWSLEFFSEARNICVKEAT